MGNLEVRSPELVGEHDQVPRLPGERDRFSGFGEGPGRLLGHANSFVCQESVVVYTRRPTPGACLPRLRKGAELLEVAELVRAAPALQELATAEAPYLTPRAEMRLQVGATPRNSPLCVPVKV